MNAQLVSILAQIAACQARVAGMQAANSHRLSIDASISYDDAAFGMEADILDRLAADASALSLTDVPYWKDGAAECTQRLATPILKLPPTAKMIAAGFRKHKSASLGEAYQHFMGKPLENAHSAMADARACMDVWFAIKQGARVAA